MTKQVLIVSPIPSHPQFQGNSARIYRFNKLWQRKGFKVHFLYFGMEGLSIEDEKKMRECWDFFYYIQPQGGAAEPSYVDYYDIDDWYDERVGALVDRLCDLWDFEACVVNYVWFSKALESVPEGVRKIIDTHDVFGDRHLVAKSTGVAPSWFYTSKELEGYGLRRADIVLAIQDEEKNFLESTSGVTTVVMGHVAPLQSLPNRDIGEGKKLRVGFIGSGNPFNERSITAFHDSASKQTSIFDNCNFSLAGTICRVMEQNDEIFEHQGIIDELVDFYRSIDLVINPMQGGTGLKIKSLEAFSFGKPIIASKDAMVGIEVFDDLHRCRSTDEIVHYLCDIDSPRLDTLRKNSLRSLQVYNARFISAFELLVG